MSFWSRIIDPNDREVMQHLRTAAAIGELEPELQALDDVALRQRSLELRAKARFGEGRFDGGAEGDVELVDLDELLVKRSHCAERPVAGRPDCVISTSR